ncbi:hypothetical protein QUF63_04740 [Anaerolineales bacterium HSG25]|nr:hypothetical protein [Anaerolineales bacterium HSG25]
MSNLSKTPQLDLDNFRMYHRLQYDRISQLEQQRLTMTNLVIVISTFSFTFGFAEPGKLNFASAIGLPIIIIISNSFALMYSHRSREFIKMHQRRAEEARKLYALEFNDINKKVGKRNSNKDPFNRTKLQIYLHILLMTIALLPMAVYLQQ